MRKIIGVTVGTPLSVSTIEERLKPAKKEYVDNTFATKETAAGLETRIKINDKRITNIEKGLVPDAFETDSSVAYTKDAPSDACPYAELTKLGGMTRKCTNLFNVPYFNSFLSNNCSISHTDGGFLVTVTGDDPYWFYIDGSLGLESGNYYVYFSVDGGAYAVVQNAGGIIHKSGSLIPFGADAWHFELENYTIGNTYTVKVAFSKEPMNRFEPYFEGLRSAPTEAVESVGVNLWDEEWEVGYINLENGDLLYNTETIRSKNFITVKPSITYYMYNGSWNEYRIAFYDNSKNIISATSGNPFTTPSNCYYIKFYSAGTEYKNDICVNRSNAAINGNYYPYTRNTLPIPEAVRPKNGINENVYDYIEWCEDGSVKQGVRCGFVDLASLPWSLLSSTAAMVSINDMDITPAWDVSKLPSKIANMLYDGTLPLFYLFFEDGAYTSIDELRADLNGVQLVYELATPEVTDISDILPADNYIGVEGGGTLTFKNEYEYDVPSEVTYQIKGATV